MTIVISILEEVVMLDSELRRCNITISEARATMTLVRFSFFPDLQSNAQRGVRRIPVRLNQES